MSKKHYSNFFSLILDFKFGLIVFLCLPFLDTVVYLLQQTLITNILNIIAESQKEVGLILKFFVYLVIVSGFYEIFRNFKSLYVSVFAVKLKRLLDINLVSQVLDYEESFFSKYGSAMILTAVRNITDGVEDAVYYFKSTLSSIVYLIGILYTLNSIAPVFAYITIAWILAWLVISNFILKFSYKYALKTAEYKRIFSLNLGDILNNMFTIKTFNTAEEEKNKNKILVNDVYQISQKVNIVDFVLDAFSTILYMMFFGCYLYYIYFLWSANLIKIGEITLIVKFINDIYDNLDDVNDNLADFLHMTGQVNDGLRIIDKGKIAKIVHKTQELEVNSGSIQLKNLKYKYDDRDDYQLCLRGVLDVPAGSVVAMVGASGGGKTTFFKVLLGILSPNEGEIMIDNQNILNCSTDSVRSAFALVPQDVGLFHRSIYDNIKYGSSSASFEDVQSVIEDTNLTEVISSLEKGIGSIIGEDTEFSGGQKQRIMLARGLLRKAKIFLFDESTSALDAKNENDILTSIGRITEGYTKFIIAHRIKTVETADIILVFDKGSIVEKGTHQELLEKGGLYKELVNLL